MRLNEEHFDRLIKKAMEYAETQIIFYRDGDSWNRDSYKAEVWCNRYYMAKKLLIEHQASEGKEGENEY